MQISSVDHSYWLSALASPASASNAAAQTNAQAETAGADSADISRQALNMGKLPPPPHEMDFSSLSDDDLKDYLQRMYDVTGTVPGMDAGTTVGDLTEEQLGAVRGTLIEMSRQAPPQQLDSDTVSSMSDDDFQSLLLMILNMTGSIFGMEGSEDTDTGSLFGSELDMIRDYVTQYLSESLAERLTQDQARTARQATTAYEDNSTANVYENYTTI
jgi:hypothetical protein